MRYLDQKDLVTGLVVAAICWGTSQLGRMFDLAAPDLARRVATLATRMLPKTERDSEFYNFEADAQIGRAHV